MITYSQLNVSTNNVYSCGMLVRQEVGNSIKVFFYFYLIGLQNMFVSKEGARILPKDHALGITVPNTCCI